eukprot:m.86481 g.86481  ORF g.86481 m.86481 type:complete len:121 (-) comp12812_c0_seq1:226-588(-)
MTIQPFYMFTVVCMTCATLVNACRAELHKGALTLRSRIAKFRPTVLCFNGKGIFQIFMNQSKCVLGLQPVQIEGAKVFVMPSTSSRGAAYPRWQDKIEFFEDLAKVVNSCPQLSSSGDLQ